MKNRIDIRTLNANKHNPLLPSRFRRIQSRAAAVLDAWKKYGAPFTLDAVALLHEVSSESIHNDTYGNSLDIDKRFSLYYSTKLEHALQICLEEIENEIDPLLVAIVNHVSFSLIRQIKA